VCGRLEGRPETATGKGKGACRRSRPRTSRTLGLSPSASSAALGLDIGLEEAGFSVRFASEIDEDAVGTITANRPHVPLIGDIHEYTAGRAREAAGIGDSEIHLVVGGPPCQPVSSAGRRRALDDVRGVAVLKFVSLALELRPQYVAIESVRSLLSADGGEVMAKMLAMLRESHYVVSYQLYDAAYFGVPQHRERVIIIGSRNGSRVPYLAPTHSGRPADGLPPWRTLRDAIGDMAGIEHHYVEFPEERQVFLRKLKAGQDWRDLSEDDQKAALSEAVREGNGGKTGFYRRLPWDEPSPTLMTRPDMPATCLCHPDELRPLSIEEYRRLQGFPEEWVFCGDVLSQYRQIGNAVPIPFAKAIGLAILEHMRTGISDDPMPGFRYSRYTRASDGHWCQGNTNGQAPPRHAARPSRSAAVAPPSTNGDGKQSHDPPPAIIEGLRLMSNVTQKPTEWLWDGYIALGELTILEGHPDTNKSSLMIDVAARLTRGGKMPCVPATGSRPLKGGVLILVGEDSIEKTAVVRLKAAGADLDQVAVLENVTIPDDVLAIEKAIVARGVKLLIIDTLNDFLNCNVLSNQQVRRALRKLRKLAERMNIAVVLLRHFVKSPGGRSLLRGGGSVAITAMARSQLKVFKHPDDPNLRVLVHDKCNLGPLSPSLMFEVMQQGSACRLEWHGETKLTIEDLEQKHKGSPALEAAEQFLLEKLKDGPREVNSLIEQAKGICSKRTLDEAKRELNVKTVRKGNKTNHKIYWCL
jgi:DNA (cytosine-5)-methyltransferase 1